MRCLYCGKELALFKRLRGGEFCSDSHRQKYQEEYTQLALNRLLQQAKEAKEKEAKSERAEEPESPALKRREKVIREEAPAAAPASPAPVIAAQTTAVLDAQAAPPADSPVPQLVEAVPAPATRAEERRAVAVEPSVVAGKDEPAPAAMSGFLSEIPQLTAAEPPAPLDLSEVSISSPAPILPRLGRIEPDLDSAHLDSAPRITLSLITVTDCPMPSRERGLELREFVRGVPQVEIQVKPAVESGFEPVREALEVTIEPCPPGASPVLWYAPEVGLVPEAGNETLPGDLSRLDFALTEWGESAAESGPQTPGSEPVSEPSSEPVSEPVSEPSVGPGLSAEPPALAARLDSAPIQPARHEPATSNAGRHEPMRFEPVHIDPVFMQTVAANRELEREAEVEPEAVAETAADSEASVSKTELAPLVTKPLPVTLHGLAPVRGKPVQVYTSAAARADDVQVPRDAALPLRPIMVLGNALKAAVAEPVQEEPAATPQPVPEKQEPRPRKSEVRVVHLKEQAKERSKEQTKSEPARPAPKPEPSKATAPVPAAKAEPRPEQTKQSEQTGRSAKATQVEKPAESPKTSRSEDVIRPSAAARPEEKTPVQPAGELDTLGLPHLSFQQKESAWSRLPLAVRLGGIGAVLALIIGGIVLTSHGSGSAKPAAATSNEPIMVEEPALAATAGWAQDWFADRPSAKANRHVDILRGSLTQRDYRLLFEGQIERGALGWVFRAADKSFYVEKIQEITPGRDPQVALVRFAVINGQEQPRTQVPLPIQAHLDTTYKVRMDIIGDRFTTWVQDQKVDQWTDGQITVGGVGLYYENGESAKLRDTLNVIPLKRK